MSHLFTVISFLLNKEQNNSFGSWGSQERLCLEGLPGRSCMGVGGPSLRQNLSRVIGM